MSINNYYYKNRDKVLTRAADYYMENKEYIKKRSKLYFKKYYEKNKERIIKNVKKNKELKPKQPRIRKPKKNK
jgi:hypothetical protein